jgi:hypothetical protein
VDSNATANLVRTVLVVVTGFIEKEKSTHRSMVNHGWCDSLDGFGDFGLELSDSIHTKFECPQSLQFLVFTHRHEVSDHLSVASDGDRLAVNLIYAPLEIFGKLSD